MRYYILSILSVVTFLTLTSESALAARKKISGEAVVDIAEDFKNNKSEMIYSVRDKASGRLQRLQFKTSEFPI